MFAVLVAEFHQRDSGRDGDPGSWVEGGGEGRAYLRHIVTIRMVKH